MARDGKLIIAYIELCTKYTQGGTERTDTSCCHTMIGNVSFGSVPIFIRIPYFNKWHNQLNWSELRLLRRVTNYYIGHICLASLYSWSTSQSEELYSGRFCSYRQNFAVRCKEQLSQYNVCRARDDHVTRVRFLAGLIREVFSKNRSSLRASQRHSQRSYTSLFVVCKTDRAWRYSYTSSSEIKITYCCTSIPPYTCTLLRLSIGKTLCLQAYILWCFLWAFGLWWWGPGKGQKGLRDVGWGQMRSIVWWMAQNCNVLSLYEHLSDSDLGRCTVAEGQRISSHCWLYHYCSTEYCTLLTNTH